MRSSVVAVAAWLAGCGAGPPPAEIPATRLWAPLSAADASLVASRGEGSETPSTSGPACRTPEAKVGGKLAPRPLTAEQVAAIDAAAHSSGAPRELQAELLYARARAFFEAQHWAEAAEDFRDIALNDADLDVGIYASQLYLECINILGTHAEPPRPSCFDEMASAVPVFIELYCQGAKEKQNHDACTVFAKIQIDIERLTVEKLIERADKGAPDAPAVYGRAAEGYLALAKRCLEAAGSRGEPPSEARCDELAFGAALAFRAAGRTDRAEEARSVLLDPKNGMAASPLAKELAAEEARRRE